MLRFFYRFKYFDIPLLAATLVLASAGLAILYGTTLSEDTKAIFYRQLVFLGLGLGGFFLISLFDYHTLAKLNRIIYPLLVVFLLYLLVFGSIIHGGRRWIDFASFGLQPAELMKLSVVLGLARLLYLKRGQINSWPVIIWSLLYALIPALLIIREPDLGSALIILGIWAGVLLISKAKKHFLVILLIVFVSLGGVAWKFVLKDFQKDRIMVFLDPNLDPAGRGYNVRQATIAVGSGEFLGRGLGKGIESQRKFLPERQTDFIFAASSEEIGFLGSFSLIALYFFLFSRIIRIAKRAKDDLAMYMAGGIFFFFFLQTVINIAMNIGLLPVTGIPLPLVSAGGSSLVVSLLALGIAQNIAIQSKVLRF